MSVYVIVADGVRPDTMAGAIARGELPALGALSEEGGSYTVTTAFPSVTGVAYAPLLTGRAPGRVGLPGLRWFDRHDSLGSGRLSSRSYVGWGLRHLDRDLASDSTTVFERVPNSVVAMSAIYRGTDPDDRIGGSLDLGARIAVAHFRGDQRGWLDIDRRVARRFLRQVRERRPRFAFAAFLFPDKASHAHGHDAPVVLEGLRLVDEVVAELRHDAERTGTWASTHIWVISDHGHSPVHSHDELVDVMRDAGLRVYAHPLALDSRANVAVMVSGNAMAHIYLGLERATRPGWPALAREWRSIVDDLSARESVDLIALPIDARSCEVRRGRGSMARLAWSGEQYSYLPVSGDPLCIGEQPCLTAQEAHEVTMASPYPDSLVQLAALASCSRAGDAILSAATGWDFRRRHEPIPHRSTHGSLSRDHMLVPLLVSHAPERAPMRSADVAASALSVLGEVVPDGYEGVSFVAPSPATRVAMQLA
jgi:arylsulfatase A-like enzyme